MKLKKLNFKKEGIMSELKKFKGFKRFNEKELKRFAREVLALSPLIDVHGVKNYIAYRAGTNKNNERRVSFLILLSGLFFLQSCTCSGGKNRTDSQVVNDMAQQNNVKAQEGTKIGEAYVKLPPEGTRARNRRYYPYTRDPLKAAKELKNPLEPTADVLSQGQKYYKMYCIYCHGVKGDSGEGASVTPKMAIKPASLLTEKAKAYKDGRIYHIIYEGQGLMGAYNLQLETEEQVVLSHHSKNKAWKEYKGSNKIWSVVHYVRKLQNKITQTSSEEKTPENPEEKDQDNSKEKTPENSKEKTQDKNNKEPVQ